MGTSNLHKVLRELITKIDNQKISSHLAPVDIFRDTTDVKEDYEIIIQLTDFISEKTKSADPYLRDIILGILLVDNYKYLLKSTKNVELELDGFSQLIIYEKTDDLKTLKEKLKTDDNFYFEVFRNVIELYYTTPDEEYYLIQKNISKKMNDKFLLLDKTYIYDQLEYQKNLKYDLNSMMEEIKNQIPEDRSSASMNVYVWQKAEEIYHKIKLLSTYDLEMLKQNIYSIIISVYNMKKEEVNQNGIQTLSKIDLLFLYQVEHSSIENYISSFFTDGEEKISIIYYYIVQELKTENIKQKEQTKNPKN